MDSWTIRLLQDFLNCGVIHEPSHLAGLKKDVEDEKLDFDEWKKYWKLREKVKKAQAAGTSQADFWKSLSQAEKDTGSWAQKNNATIQKVLDKRNDADEMAKEEIDEYEKEVKFFEALLKYLKGLEEH